MDGHSLRLPAMQTRRAHAAATLRLAAPLAVAQLAQLAMGITDTVLLGGLSTAALAAGGLGGGIMITALVVLQGVLTAVSVLVAQARGAGRDADVPALYWTGMTLTVLLTVPAFLLFSMAHPLMIAAGEPPALAADVDSYLSVLRWAIPGGLVGIGLLRAFLPAVGGGAAILWVTLGQTVVNFGLCYGLIHGAWGLPAMGLRGAALATVIVWTLGAIVLLAVVHAGPRCRAFVRWAPPRWAMLRAMLRLGLPVGATFATETSLFLAISLLIGRLGPAPLAAQQVGLNVLTVAFMIPLGIAQAANVRVGHCVGARDAAGARRAGLVAIGLAIGFEVAASILVALFPGPVAALFLDRTDAAYAIAVGLLQVCAVFQVADGVQVVAGGALRGLGDTRIPFLVAALGYWVIGFPVAWWLAVHAGAGATGAWWGMAASLAVVAALLTVRFLLLSRRATVAAVRR